MMNKRYTHVISAVLMSLIFIAPAAEARRLGGGKSYGMSRQSSSSSQYSGTSSSPSGAPVQRYAPSQSAPAAPMPAPATPQRSGVGMGGLAAGVAAGAVGGYLLGHSNTAQAAPGNAGVAPVAGDNGAAAPAVDQAANQQAAVRKPAGTPWLLIILLATGGFLLYRRFSGNKPKFVPFSGQDSGNNNVANFPSAAPQAMADNAYTGTQTLADGSPSAAFLRQARSTFMHLQTMNSASHIEELRRYFTADMFTQISAEIASNDDTAEFPQLNAQLLNSSAEAGQFIASVEFSGMVSESLNNPPEAFNETWHFVKAVGSDSPWLVAGIQQG